MDLEGKRILVVEDDFYLADEMCQDLRRQGAIVLGPAPTPFYAMQLLGRRGVDGAVLDVRLHGTTVFSLADELTRRGTPIIFATAFGDEAMPERYKGKPRLTKPYDRSRLIEAILEMGNRRPAEPVAQPRIMARSAADDNRDADPRTRMMRAICVTMRRSYEAASARQ
ncbi:response regulator [Devosia sp. BK]|uniref:response regulator n=1 Tax=Devosia sp. BK TaxID=2871706 RepID=UPI0029396CD0|nr:response regulator [Devosia sp. BK]MDV3249896.1 response regulator [Devosia sp. BK]